jgi:membrane protease YdiL (CAAX protease family)
LIAASVVGFVAYLSVAHAELKQLLVELGIPPKVPRRLPRWVIAASCVAAAVFLAACLSRRGRAMLRVRPRLTQPSAHGEVYLEAFALCSVAWCVLLVACEHVGTAALMVITLLIPVAAVVYGFSRCRSIRAPLADWGWRPGRGVWIELSIGAVAGLVGTALRHLPGEALEPVDEALLTPAGMFYFLNSVVLVPVTEETLHRGVLYRHVRDWARWPLAALLTAAVFGAFHPLPRFAYTLAGGLIYALLREWRGSILAPVAAHSTHNLVGRLLLMN